MQSRYFWCYIILKHNLNVIVQLDAEQADNICFLTTGSSGIDAKNELWLSDIVKTPDWPAPWPKLSEDEIVTDYRQFAVFWKASVVANDGHVSNSYCLCVFIVYMTNHRSP